MNKHEFICAGMLEIISKHDVIENIDKSNKDDVIKFLKETAEKFALVYDNTLKVYEEERWPKDIIEEIKKSS